MMRTIICICMYIAVVQAIAYKDCGSKGAKILAAAVNGCTGQICPFTQGKNVTLTLNYTANEDMTKPRNSVKGIIAGVQVPFPVTEDCCSNKNLACPVKSGTSGTYTLTIFVSPSYPKIQLLVQGEVLDDTNQPFFCVIFPAKIVSQS